MDGETISAVLSLGERIGAALDENDLPSQWMAQHIAERMTALESLQGADHETAENDLADRILQLWAHRRGATFREDPLGQTEAVLRAVARLDPDAQRAFFPALSFGPKPQDGGEHTDERLRIALALDKQVAELIRTLISDAAESAQTADGSWVEAARAANVDPLAEIENLIAVYSGAISRDDDPQAARRARITTQATQIRDLLAPLAGDAPAG